MIPLSQDQRDGVRRRLLDGTHAFAAEWSADRVVIAVPELDDDARTSIVDALSPGGQELLFLTTEELGDAYPAQSVLAAPSQVNAWRWEFMITGLVYACPNLSAAALETPDEFTLIGGARNTIEKALGQTIEDARVEFAVYAQEMARACRHLPGIAERYR